MSITSTQTQHPTTPQLVKATLAAAAIAGIILITTVLPAEHGIDPTGIGGALLSASSYLMKSPPEQRPDDLGRAKLEAFIRGEVER